MVSNKATLGAPLLSLLRDMVLRWATVVLLAPVATVVASNRPTPSGPLPSLPALDTVAIRADRHVESAP